MSVVIRRGSEWKRGQTKEVKQEEEDTKKHINESLKQWEAKKEKGLIVRKPAISQATDSGPPGNDSGS